MLKTNLCRTNFKRWQKEKEKKRTLNHVSNNGDLNIRFILHNILNIYTLFLHEIWFFYIVDLHKTSLKLALWTMNLAQIICILLWKFSNCSNVHTQVQICILNILHALKLTNIWLFINLWGFVQAPIFISRVCQSSINKYKFRLIFPFQIAKQSPQIIEGKQFPLATMATMTHLSYM